jgi:hypothetical protein
MRTWIIGACLWGMALESAEAQAPPRPQTVQYQKVQTGFLVDMIVGGEIRKHEEKERLERRLERAEDRIERLEATLKLPPMPTGAQAPPIVQHFYGVGATPSAPAPAPVQPIIIGGGSPTPAMPGMGGMGAGLGGMAASPWDMPRLPFPYSPPAAGPPPYSPPAAGPPPYSPPAAGGMVPVSPPATGGPPPGAMTPPASGPPGQSRMASVPRPTGYATYVRIHRPQQWVIPRSPHSYGLPLPGSKEGCHPQYAVARKPQPQATAHYAGTPAVYHK